MGDLAVTISPVACSANTSGLPRLNAVRLRSRHSFGHIEFSASRFHSADAAGPSSSAPHVRRRSARSYDRRSVGAGGPIGSKGLDRHSDVVRPFRGSHSSETFFGGLLRVRARIIPATPFLAGKISQPAHLVAAPLLALVESERVSKRATNLHGQRASRQCPGCSGRSLSGGNSILSNFLATVNGFFVFAIEDRFERPHVFVTHDATEILLGRQHGRSRPTFCHRLVPPSAYSPGPSTNSRMRFSIKFVLARRRCREGGISIRLIVKHSSIPSRRLWAASGCSLSSHFANFSSFAIPSFASSSEAARISDLVCPC